MLPNPDMRTGLRSRITTQNTQISLGFGQLSTLANTESVTMTYLVVCVLVFYHLIGCYFVTLGVEDRRIVSSATQQNCPIFD